MQRLEDCKVKEEVPEPATFFCVEQQEQGSTHYLHDPIEFTQEAQCDRDAPVDSSQQMEFRLRASQQQFLIMLDFMERYGDLTRPLPGVQGRLRAENLWRELTTMLNSVGENGVKKPIEKWKKVWSDYKAKIKKKASAMKKESHATGGGPTKFKPLSTSEERVLNIIGFGSITAKQDSQETGFEVMLTDQITPHQDPIHIPQTQPTNEDVVDTKRIQDDVTRSPSVGPCPRRNRAQRRRRRHTPFEEATSDFIRIEEGRLHLEETRIEREHEREMERLRVESLRISMEERRTDVFQQLVNIGNNIAELLSRTSS